MPGPVAHARLLGPVVRSCCPCAPPVPRRRAHHPCGMAVGRDVPIAPPRHCLRWLTAAVRGLASCAPLLCPPRLPPWNGGGLPRMGVTGRRALRGYRGRTETPPTKLSACATCHYPRALPTTTGRCGAMGTSRPTAITPAWGAPPFTHAHYPGVAVRGLASCTR